MCLSSKATIDLWGVNVSVCLNITHTHTFHPKPHCLNRTSDCYPLDPWTLNDWVWVYLTAGQTYVDMLTLHFYCECPLKETTVISRRAEEREKTSSVQSVNILIDIQCCTIFIDHIRLFQSILSSAEAWLSSIGPCWSVNHIQELSVLTSQRVAAEQQQ